MTPLGILFDPSIWSFAKASQEELDKTAARFQADLQKRELLSVLDEQVSLLAEEGRPNLFRFLESLEVRSIASSKEISTLRAEYGLESCLDTALDHVVERVSHLLGKHLLNNENDAIIVNGTVEIPSSMFNRLKSREWLKCWDIAAALEMTDRPAFVYLGVSIPLHEKDENGEVTSISSPSGRWRKDIDSYMRGNTNDLERPLVFICPLNSNANHFLLLEINEQTRTIYHYDSIAAHGIIRRKTKSTLVRRVVEAEFNDLGFRYTEASCGLMVIHNAKQHMNGLSIGACDSEVDPDRVTQEVIGNCEMFLESDALPPQLLSKKRKKKLRGAQSNAPHAVRSSKKAQSLEIFGGPNGRNKPILEKFLDEAEKRGIGM
ncbi:uncharacterized protein RAG0_12566 [Rhynchosporium agropyri]|uniref:Ubiquitin-like protease family profile domain-containing protein n=1 Tax=Rhynchosporium agropyri TaxID=914238 RepID=A0A1E1L8V5_9HELO|nr:uncharacterized protein RAG0_12566 [Rhynchosporium agropyri]